jgi:hypothetical protein
VTNRSRIETAAGERRDSFPPQWGEPPADSFSPERSAWVLRNIHDAALKRNSRVALTQALALSGAPRRSAHLALAQALALGPSKPGRSVDQRAADPTPPAASTSPNRISESRAWHDLPPLDPADLARGRAIANTFCDYVDPADLAVLDAYESATAS